MEVTPQVTVDVTYEQVLSFRNNAAHYQQSHPKDRNEFMHALGRVLKFTKDAADDYTELLNEIQVKHAKTDEKTKNFILDSKDNYIFDGAGKIAFHKDHRALLGSPVSVRSQISQFVPKDISYPAWAVFYPFVLSDEFPPIPQEETVLAEPAVV